MSFDVIGAVRAVEVRLLTGCGFLVVGIVGMFVAEPEMLVGFVERPPIISHEELLELDSSDLDILVALEHDAPLYAGEKYGRHHYLIPIEEQFLYLERDEYVMPSTVTIEMYHLERQGLIEIARILELSKTLQIPRQRILKMSASIGRQEKKSRLHFIYFLGATGVVALIFAAFRIKRFVDPTSSSLVERISRGRGRAEAIADVNEDLNGRAVREFTFAGGAAQVVIGERWMFVRSLFSIGAEPIAELLTATVDSKRVKLVFKATFVTFVFNDGTEHRIPTSIAAGGSVSEMLHLLHDRREVLRGGRS